jgi:hypothetical protein
VSEERDYEREREVGDAITYERAARALRRRHGEDIRGLTVLHRAPERIRLAVYTLESEAQRLRGECASV